MIWENALGAYMEMCCDNDYSETALGLPERRRRSYICEIQRVNLGQHVQFIHFDTVSADIANLEPKIRTCKSDMKTSAWNE